MKNCLKTVAGIMILAAGSVSVEAADYADLSIDELVQQRSRVRELAPEDRESYRTEMQSRMQSMSSDERAQFRETNNMGGQGEGSGKMNRYGQGNSNGSGNKHRYGQDNSQGYGSGYGSRQGGGNGGGRRNR
jgi:hypothetical protein